jgi:hypothetical protein
MALDSYDCELCLFQREEKIRHLFFSYPFAKNCWNALGINPLTWLNIDRSTKSIKRQLHVPFAMDIIVIMCWRIWTKRNAWIINNESPQAQSCFATFRKEFAMVIL